jgi:nitrogen-specific signal transduction histidine kinase/CheY-like chemotaxis protein
LEELERAEERLRYAQKMETVGTLAGGLAHDFNNVLATVLGTVSLMRAEIEAGRPPQAGELARALIVIEEASRRAAAVIKQLLAFARGRSEHSPKRTRVDDVVQATAKLCRATFDSSVSVEADRVDLTLSFDVDQNELVQALLNLCINGNHAMTLMRGPDEPQGGTLSLRARRAGSAELERTMEPGLEPGRPYVAIEVDDEGVGMDEATVGRVFDPFFTTKPQGIGNGLGMSMAYATIRNHDGFLKIRSAPGKGTTVTVFLPLAAPEETPRVEASGSSIGVRGPSLVVEDDRDVRMTVFRMLEAAGADPVAAEGGRAALEIVDSGRRDFAFALVDMAMPEMSGLATLRALKERLPSLPVIVMSGYRYDERIGEAMDYGAAAFVQKPFSLEELSAALRSAVERGQGAP